MPVAALIRIPDPARLLERAVDGLFPLDAPSAARPWPTLRAWLVLRQGGLRDDLHRLAAARGVTGWFDPSICLFNELGAQWGGDDGARALSEQERHAILARLLDERGRECFGAATDAWVPAVDRFVGELIGEGIAPEAFGAAMHRVAQDAHDRLRADTLGEVYAQWHALLGREGRVDGRDLKVRLAHRITSDPARFAERLGHRREVRVVGLADLRGGWRPLLAALATSGALDRVEVLTSVDLAVGGPFVDDEPGTAPASPSPEVRLLEAPDAAREAELVAVRVRALLDGGVRPSSIAVIARQARPAVDAVARALDEVGVPVTARRRTGLLETAPARAVMALLDAAREGWSRHGVIELAEHPLLDTALDARVLNTVGYARSLDSLDGWRDALTGLLDQAVAREHETTDPEVRRKPLPASAAIRRTIAAWDALAPRLRFLDGSHLLEEWCAWARVVLHDPSWGIATALDRVHVVPELHRDELRARDAITAVIDAWIGAIRTFGGSGAAMEAARFADRLALMLAQDLVTPPATDFGVVVAEALAAGWRAFDHVFLVGLDAGEFPRRPAPGQLVDPRERGALIAAGLPLDAADAWRAREAELFRVLTAAAATTLTLSWPEMDAEGQEVARSVFVDDVIAGLAARHVVPPGAVSGEADDVLAGAKVLLRVPPEQALVPGFPAASDDAALARAREVADRERARSLDPSPWNGGIDDPALVAALATRYGESYQWSATQLEQAAKCRWHWFAARQLGLEEIGEAGDELEPTVSGSLRHDALARFFRRAAAERFAGGPVQLREGDLAWAIDAIAQALDDAWQAAHGAGEWLGPSALHGIARAELRRELQEYVRFEVKRNEDARTKPQTNAAKEVLGGAIADELAFEGLELEGDGVTFRLRGSIDRVDEGQDERVAGSSRYLAAIDYKSSKASTPAGGRKQAWDDGIVLQVPLYARALELLRPGHVVARMEYRTLRRPGVEHQLRLVGVRKGEVVAHPEARERLERALAHAGRVIASVRAATLPARPTESAGCPPFCPAWDVCRIPGGPRVVR